MWCFSFCISSFLLPSLACLFYFSYFVPFQVMINTNSWLPEKKISIEVKGALEIF